MHKQESFQTRCSNHMSSVTSKESSICIMNVVASAMKNATKSTGYISYLMSRLLGNKCHFAIVFCPFFLLYNLVKMSKRSNWVYSIQAVVMNKEIRFSLKRNQHLFMYTVIYSFLFLIQTRFFKNKTIVDCISPAPTLDLVTRGATPGHTGSYSSFFSLQTV